MQGQTKGEKHTYKVQYPDKMRQFSLLAGMEANQNKGMLAEAGSA